MKKVLSMLLVFSMLLSVSAALAEGMGVQVIGGPASETEPVSLDDLKLDSEIPIDGWGIICATGFEIQNSLGYYKQGSHELDYYNRDHGYYESGIEADYAILYVDITNTQRTQRDFLSNVEVKAVYDDAYEYGGWAYQRNYNNGIRNEYDEKSYYAIDYGKQNTRFVIDRVDQFSIDSMYQGHYLFGCTLPNAVINSKQPLCLIITIDGNEITYNIRK